jgi:phosphopantetheinyl transferase
MGPHLVDHHFMGRPVLPAVEALQALALAAREHHPNMTVAYSRQADFLRFLQVEETGQDLPAVVEFESHANGSLTCSLLTQNAAKNTTMVRFKEHVAVTFASPPPWPLLPLDLTVPEGPALFMDAERMYAELVPFGPAFHNTRGRVHLSRGGALATVAAPRWGSTGPLGSPFPLDAAFHLACAWGQRYEGLLGFPTGYAERLVLNPTRAGENYLAVVLPQGRNEKTLFYDLWLLDRSGRHREAVLGLRMEDVSRGRFTVPDWIRANDPSDSESPADRPFSLAVVELASLPPFSDKLLSLREKFRWQNLGSRRKKSFLGARLALKRLSRRLAPDGLTDEAPALDTLAADNLRPALAGPGSSRFQCSAAHDDRLAAAVAAEEPIGLDVEKISDRALRGRSLFMSESEQSLLASSGLGQEAAAVRVWTIKEATAKALSLTLPEAWRKVEVTAIGKNLSLADVDGRTLMVHHIEVDDHVLSITLPDHHQNRAA